MNNNLLEAIYITVIVGGIILSYQSSIAYFVNFSRKIFASKCSLSQIEDKINCTLNDFLTYKSNNNILSFYYYWLLWTEVALYFFIAITFLSGFSLAAFATKALPFTENAMIIFILLESFGMLSYYTFKLICTHKVSALGFTNEELW